MQIEGYHMDVGQIISTFLTQATLLAAATWLIKTLISNSLVKDTEQFKSNLLLANDEFKSGLSIDAHRQTTVFSALHEQRAKVIADVYALLAPAEQAIRVMVAPFQQAGAPDGTTLMHNSAAAMRTLSEKFAANRIWFSQPTCKKADAVLNEMLEIHNRFNIMAGGGSGKNREVNTEEWVKSWDRVKDQLPGLRGALEADFRTILGVEN
jgi:quinol monooxygenase YgiN